MRIAFLLLLTSISVCSINSACADITDFQNPDEWFDAVEGHSVTTLDFTGFADQTPINEQYAHLGVHFIGFDLISGENWFLAPNDGWGLWGYDEETVMTFDEPVFAIGAAKPGTEKVQLFRDGVFIGESGWLGAGGYNFGGIISDEPFDEVRWYDPPEGTTWFDDMYFVPVPSPGALPVLAALMLCSRRRRVHS